MNRIRLWPHGVLMILGVAVLAGIAAALWFKYERSAQASGLPNAARLERVDGQVGVNRSLDSASNSQWVEARANTPVSVGDRIYTKENSRTEVAFTGRNAATIDPNTSLDILDLSRDRTQVALRTGSALFDVGSISSGQIFEVATPCGAVDLSEPGTYQLAIDPNGNATATAFSGSAQLVGQAGSGTIRKGEVLSVPCQDAQSATISRVNYDQAGTSLDNHFRYRYPRAYDGRYRSYYTYLDDPNYYDPYRRYNSYNYVSDYVPGVEDLDDYGNWSYVNDYGYAWHPRVETGWAPYQSGYWEMDYPYGLTWVSNEPWGYAPYHYGRWAYASNEWFWVPESTTTYPTYSPALTAFIPLGNSSVAWVALGPGDPYVSHYYDPNWQPVYLTSPTVTQGFVNIGVPDAVTAVPVQSFAQVIDRRDIIQVDPQTITQVRPVIDPLTVSPLRQAAFDTRRAERRFDMSQAVAQRLNNTPVVAVNTPAARPFRRDLATAMGVQPLPARARSQELKLKDDRAITAQQQPQSPAPNIAAEQARERQMADLARQAARGDRGARQQMQELRRQQAQQGRVEGVANQTAQGDRVGQPMPPVQSDRQMMRQQQQAQREAARQQMQESPGQKMQRARVEGVANQQPRGDRVGQPIPRIQSQREAKPPQIQRGQPPVIRHAPNAQPLQPQPQRKSEVQVQRQQSQPRVMSAPRPQPMPQQQPRPQMERRGPPAQMPQPQAQPRAQQQPRVQQQAQPHPQAQAQPKGQQQQPAKAPGKPPKKP